ncbi:MAG TPA: DUF4157 domain-containing protein [Blastocatellia bacterium]|nr:DUF4157 domain-containing protein [Blastocatellia bacterium]
MSSFSQIGIRSQEQVLVSLARFSEPKFAASHQPNPLSNIHTAAGSQALESLRSTPEEKSVEGSSAVTSRFAYDFSRIPVAPSAASELRVNLAPVSASAPTIQRKPVISSPSDAYELEADQVAEKVMRMAPPVLTTSAGASIGRKCAECEDEQEKRIQTKASSATPANATLDAGAAMSAIDRGGGAPLPREVRSYFEPRFGYDFSRVRVHAGDAAAHGARAVRARAYTIGRDIVFASGEYAPATMRGKRLLAHELAHVVQQGHSHRRDGNLAASLVGTEAAHMNQLPSRALEEADLSTRSIAESPAVVSRKEAGPDETSGSERGSGNKPKDLKQISKDLCVNQPIDDTKAECQFSSAQLNMVRLIKEHALRTCTKSMAAINMHGNEGEVIRIAKDYFNVTIKLSAKTKRTLLNIIKTVSDKLEHSAIVCGTCQDKHCNGGAIAHVDEARTFLVLCPRFFNSELHKTYLTPRYLIHEAGHLAGIDKNTSLREEFYCDQGATKEEKCPVLDAIHNVDAWSHFIEELAYTI